MTKLVWSLLAVALVVGAAFAPHADTILGWRKG
jgi:hypothetical protein